jgi:hypothetical protein
MHSTGHVPVALPDYFWITKLARLGSDIPTFGGFILAYLRWRFGYNMSDAPCAFVLRHRNLHIVQIRSNKKI